MKKFLSLVGLVGVIGLGAAADAQVTGLAHVFSVPGVMQTGNGLATFVACTNGGTASATIGAEARDASGAVVGSQPSVTVAPGATTVFATNNAVGIAVDQNLNTGSFTKGHIRIYGSTTRGIICSAFLADYLNPLPTSMTNLSIVKKFSQKGQ